MLLGGRLFRLRDAWSRLRFCGDRGTLGFCGDWSRRNLGGRFACVPGHGRPRRFDVLLCLKPSMKQSIVVALLYRIEQHVSCRHDFVHQPIGFFMKLGVLPFQQLAVSCDRGVADEFLVVFEELQAKQLVVVRRGSLFGQPEHQMVQVLV